MDNAQKAIMIGVGLFITIIVISAVMLITQAGQDLMSQGQDQLGNISESLRIQVTEQYHGKTLTGSQVKAACSELIGKTGVKVHLTESEITDPTSATPLDSYSTAKGKIKSSTQKYKCVVSYDANSGNAHVQFVGELAEEKTST